MASFPIYLHDWLKTFVREFFSALKGFLHPPLVNILSGQRPPPLRGPWGPPDGCGGRLTLSCQNIAHSS